MAKCDPNALMAKASTGCFACQDGNVNSVLETQLLCNWLNGITPIPPVLANFLLQENGFAILQENGSHILV